MKDQTPSLRKLAKHLGLSHTTVSDALRDNPRVKLATRKRVKEAAKALGYNSNPLTTAMMSHLRRKSGASFRGVLAILDLDGPASRPEGSGRYHRELAAGARKRAEQLGFKVELITQGVDEISLPRLGAILKSRGIRGLLVLPSEIHPDLNEFELNEFAVIYTDYAVTDPPIHTTCSDHYLAMMNLLHRLRELGYTRPGLVLDQGRDRRLFHRWQGAFDIFLSNQTELKRVPSLIIDQLTFESFAMWFASSKPDVVLAHSGKVLEWMKELGVLVPETHGFCSLNVVISGIPCSGLDLQGRLLGERAIELLTAQLYHNEYGAPKTASITMIAPKWRSGCTLRAMEPSVAATCFGGDDGKSAVIPADG